MLRPVEGIPSGLLKPEEHGCCKAQNRTVASVAHVHVVLCKMNAMFIAERAVCARVNPKWKELS